MKTKLDGKEITFPDAEYISQSEKFGHQAWSYPNLKSLYKDFQMFEPFHDEMKNTIENIDFKHISHTFVID